MLTWLARHLRRLADWLDPPVPPVPMVPDYVFDRACLVVATLDAEHHTGSYKRAMAMKALRLAFPDVPRRLVALAIELAVRKVLVPGVPS